MRGAQGGGEFGVVEDGLAEVRQGGVRPGAVGEEVRGRVQGSIGVALGGGGAAGVHLARFQDDDGARPRVDVAAPVGDDLQTADGDADRVLVVGVRGVDVPVEAGGEEIEGRAAPSQPGPAPPCLFTRARHRCTPPFLPDDQRKPAVSRGAEPVRLTLPRRQRFY